ncbi:hypothetical protein [Sphingomonas abaci]|uniref:Uncharacterized protein n=1 Tax=Sphingomonas abaci TaxID=237611 RepID=A0A7W7EWU8_9SPHN|nr:hypothetical protein [Sphingomonas abaci]MBB4616938.1 hypothetical protein [Sphingomonas abaci]
MTYVIGSADDRGIVSPDRVQSVFKSILRRAQLAGWTDEALGEASGYKPRRIKAYRVEDKEPPLSVALSIAVVLGQPAVQAILATIGYTGTPTEEADADCPLDSAVNAMQALGVFMGFAADKRIDHTEEAPATEAIDIIIAELMPFSSQGRAA